MSRRNSQAKGKRPPRTYFGTLACVTVFFGLAVYSQARLQVTNRDEVMRKAEETWMLAREEASPAERGTIYSSDMRVLAQSRPKYEFWLFYDRVPCTPGFFMALAEASGIPEARISAPFKEGKKRTWLDPLDENRYQAVRRVMAEWGADGVSLEESNAREYPLAEAAVGVVGWMQEGKPRSGIELSFDKALSGQAQAEALSASLGGDTVSGADVVLTIDSSLQAVAAKAVKEAVEKNKARSGAIVVLSPATGDVLAMSHWPAFDPSSGPNGVSELSTGYMEDLQPGSTFKVLTLAKALDAGVVDESFTFDCKGSMDLGRNRLVRCDDHGPSRAHGLMNLDKAIAKSCNVCAATWALKIGRDPMLGYLRELGLLSKPEIGLPGAVNPIFDMNEWDKERQLAVLGFGQSIAVPPINLAAAIATIANDGEYVAPRLVSQVGGKRNPPSTPKRVFSPQAAQSVRRYMESVVHTDYGTAKTLAMDTRAAGKTGTAQKLGPDGGYVSSFVAMLPADQPQVLVLVVINDPRAGVIYGSVVAGPPYLEVARAAVSKLRARPSHS